MANKTIQFPPPDYNTVVDESVDSIEIDLHQPWLAALLAWALPGLGHIYQGRTGKGLLFFVCVLGTFVYGLYLGGGKVVYASVPGEPQYRWQYWCQLGVGLPAAPALVQRRRVLNHQQPLWSGLMAPPRLQPVETKDDSQHISIQPDELGKWTVDLHPRFELGTVYTVIAGLLNILVICDAYAGPLVLAHRQEKPTQREEKKEL
ncbi:MAG: DUF6677 family protein [Pirellulales bacterium]